MRTWIPTALLSTLALASCTATTSSTDMIPSDMVVEQGMEGSVRLETRGTGDGMGLGERVSGGNLRDALRQAILSCGLFPSVTSGPDAAWTLNVSVAEVTNPEADLFPKVRATLVWRLSDGSGQRVFWEQTIQTEGEADPQDDLDYMKREAVAAGRAIAENLRQGLERLSKLDPIR